LAETDFSNTDLDATAGFVADTCVGGNAYIYDETEKSCIYSFNGGQLTPHKAEETDDAGVTTVTDKGFVITYESTENCATDPTKKFTFELIGRCNVDLTTEQTTTEHETGSGLNEVIDCG